MLFWLVCVSNNTLSRLRHVSCFKCSPFRAQGTTTDAARTLASMYTTNTDASSSSSSSAMDCDSIANGDENIEFLDSATASVSSSLSAADLEEEEEMYVILIIKLLLYLWIVPPCN